jgi:hypothetical protein
MSVLPDWNSIESTARWSDGLFWAGIVALILLAATEVASHLYGSRSTYLVSERERMQRDTSTQADRHHQIETERLKNELSSAKSIMASMQKDAAQAHIQPQAAEESANQAQANAAPRALSAGQKQNLIAALSPFSGQKVTIESIIGDGDGNRFKQDFVAVLKFAEWNFDEKRDVVQATTTPPPIGVQVAVNEDEVRAGRVLQSARVFVQTLHKLGITRGNTLFVDNQVPIGMIKLTIGTRP